MDKKSFSQIYNINVNDKVEKKGKFSYLSWAYAWAEIKKIDEAATFRVIDNTAGLPFHYDERFPKIGAFVKVEMTFQDLTLIETYPILDNYNKSISVEALNSFVINTSIKRALAKVASLHGLGLYIYAGEDLPEAQEKAINITETTNRLADSIKDKYDSKPNMSVKKASPKQIELLNKLNIQFNPDISMDEASALIKTKYNK